MISSDDQLRDAVQRVYTDAKIRMFEVTEGDFDTVIKALRLADVLVDTYPDMLPVTGDQVREIRDRIDEKWYNPGAFGNLSDDKDAG